MTLAAIRVGGGRVIVVDAIDDRAASFYEHFGFRAPNPSLLCLEVHPKRLLDMRRRIETGTYGPRSRSVPSRGLELSPRGRA